MAFQGDWELLRAAAPDLREYILSKELYWPLRRTAATPGSVQTPQLTIGNLDLSLARLSALSLAPDQQAELDKAQQAIRKVREEWRANWARKAAREFSSRLSLWQQYLRELRNAPGKQAATYANEVRNRAILQLLIGDLLDGVPQNEVDQLNMLDGVLRGNCQPEDFVWESEVASAFPRGEYWFLYVSPLS